MNILISGGAKSGKSTYAEDLLLKLANNKTHYYIATMIPYDEEDHKRILNHQEKRKDKGFQTLEVGTDITNLISKLNKNDYLLLDSLTALVLNEMFKNENKLTIEELEDKLCKDFSIILTYFKNIIMVSDYIFSDCDNFSDYTTNYLKIYGHLLKMIAKKCDVVIEMNNGIKTIHKGRKLLCE